MKKISIIFVLLIGFYLTFNSEVLFLAGNAVNFCADANVLKAMRILGMVITTLKILVPVVLIITAIIKLANVIIAGEDTKDAVNNIFQKFIVGVLVFFVPTIIGAIMSRVSGYNTTNANFANCGVCLTKATSSQCKNFISSSK